MSSAIWSTLQSRRNYQKGGGGLASSVMWDRNWYAKEGGEEGLPPCPIRVYSPALAMQITTHGSNLF